MADSLIYAFAKVANAIVWTQDKDFEGLPGVKYYAKICNPKRDGCQGG
jgi:predicted nucleic acid-binding protein